jgi:raffinose/stachyose/melibiose transport system permease protein
MVSTLTPSAVDAPRTPTRSRRRRSSPYPLWFYALPALLFIVLFAIPTFASFYFSLTRWTLFSSQFIGLDNFVTFFSEPTLVSGFTHTFIYAILTSGIKVVLGILLGVLLTSRIIGRGYLRSVIFFPVLVSTVGVGLTFKILLDPFKGLVNHALALVGLYSIIAVDVWKGVGIATLIFMAGMVGIPTEYYEAAKVDGTSGRQRFFNITLPLLRPATTTVILLSLIGGLRSFDLIWTMTKGGPGFTSDVIASVIYKQYQAGFYGLSTAGNVVLFVVVAAIVVPMQLAFNRQGAKR